MMILLHPWHAHNCFFDIKTTLCHVSWSSTQAHALHFTTMVTPQNTNIPETLLNTNIKEH